jgi:hypothetical protein
MALVHESRVTLSRTFPEIKKRDNAIDRPGPNELSEEKQLAYE